MKAKGNTKIRGILAALVMMLVIASAIAVSAGAAGYTVTLHPNGGSGIQQKIENVSGIYVLPECPFDPPAGKTFYCWAVGSALGEQKLPGSAINVTSDILIAAIWDDSQSKYIKKPVGGVTSVNGYFTISYKLSIQPQTIWLQFYNDYQKNWTDNYCMATMPEYLEAFTQTDVPYVHPDTEEKIKWRIAAYLDGVAYYSNTFEIEYVDRMFVEQPQSCYVMLNQDATVDYSLNFDPTTVLVERYVEDYQTGNYWTYICGADSTEAVIPGYDSEISRKYRIAASCNEGTFYSNPFTVTWTSGFDVSFNANGGSGSMSTVYNRVGKYTLPTCAFTAPEGKIFRGWSKSANGDIIGGDSITLNDDITLYAIWQDVFTMQPQGGTTYTNEIFETEYALSVNPMSCWIQFYNDYQGKWTDNYAMVAAPESVGAAAKIQVPCIHADAEETVQWRIAVYVDGSAYYSQPFNITYETPSTEHLVLYSPGSGNGTNDIDYAIYGTQIELYSFEDMGFVPIEGTSFDYWSIRLGGAMNEESARKQAGDRIRITNDTYIIAIWKNILYGDINGDGGVGVSDVITALQMIASNDFSSLSDAQKTASDVNGDERIDVSDAIRILQH
ncbi:MAG: InlB B-repeat-containing protein, partial [Clostridia bacterium]|nr:InlB B-repeat-containing protein [Clostridia bacterium]